MKQIVSGSLSLLGARDKVVLLLVVIAQTFLALFDLAGVALIGLVVALGTAGISGNQGSTADKFLNVTGLGSIPLPNLLLWMAISAGVMLTSKSLLSFYITRRTYGFLAHRQAAVSKRLTFDLLSRPYLFVQQRTSQDTSYVLIGGVAAAILGVLGSATIAVSEIPVLVALVFVLSFVDLSVTIFTILFFGTVAILIHRVLAVQGKKLGKRVGEIEIESLESIQEAIVSYKELTVLGRRKYYANQFSELRLNASKAQGTLAVLNQATKYIYEIMLIVGGGLLLAFQLMTHDLSTSVTVITVFLAAASRLMPSLLRMQTAAVAINTSSGLAEPTITLAHSLQNEPNRDVASPPRLLSSKMNLNNRGRKADGFTGDIELRDISFTYPGETAPAISSLSLKLNSGESLAFVGPTGAGKSTIADIILGLIEPTSGDVRISGASPASIIASQPGMISYVPQNISITRGNIRDNVALGIPTESVDDNLVWQALERANLAEFLRTKRSGLQTEVGERGVQLSGGQRQRLGLARALYSRPKLIVLDEATSALDVETEAAITEALSDLEGEVTTITIAHRLATIRNCDSIIYLENGEEVARGNFEELRQRSKAFREQAKLSGL